MNENSDAYPEVIVRLNNENKYLKSEKKEEKEKLENTIKILRVEIESLKEKKRLLENECEGNLCLLDSWPGQMRTVHKNHEKYSYGNAVDEKANQNTGFTYGDKLVFLETPEDFNRRIEIWNEVKAAI